MGMGVAGVIGTLENAGRIPQNSVASLETTGGGRPAPLHSGIEKLSIRGPVIPDGDRRHGPESGGIVDEVALPVRNQDIMRVLVLRQDCLDIERWLLAPTPVERALQGGLRGDSPGQRVPFGRPEARVVNQGDVAHRST